jgi:N-hydroxyarylamine O-acetyltransferase
MRGWKMLCDVAVCPPLFLEVPNASLQLTDFRCWHFSDMQIAVGGYLLMVVKRIIADIAKSQ